MTEDEREELKAVCREESGLRSTLADLDAELQPLEVHTAALLSKRSELVEKLSAIDCAKEQLAAPPVVVEPIPEPEPAQEAFAVPEVLETEPAKEEDHGQS